MGIPMHHLPYLWSCLVMASFSCPIGANGVIWAHNALPTYLMAPSAFVVAILVAELVLQI